MTNSWNRSDMERHFNRVKDAGWLPFFIAAAEKYNVKTEVLLGTASRETGCKNIIGDGGHGHGIMQIDGRYHKSFLDSNGNGLDPESNIDYAAKLLRGNLNYFGNDYHKAVAAYNCGAGGVKRSIRNGKGIDGATTGGDYGADVLKRAEIMAELMEKESK